MFSFVFICAEERENARKSGFFEDRGLAYPTFCRLTA